MQVKENQNTHESNHTGGLSTETTKTDCLGINHVTLSTPFTRAVFVVVVVVAICRFLFLLNAKRISICQNWTEHVYAVASIITQNFEVVVRQSSRVSIYPFLATVESRLRPFGRELLSVHVEYSYIYASHNIFRFFFLFVVVFSFSFQFCSLLYSFRSFNI